MRSLDPLQQQQQQNMASNLYLPVAQRGGGPYYHNQGQTLPYPLISTPARRRTPQAKACSTVNPNVTVTESIPVNLNHFQEQIHARQRHPQHKGLSTQEGDEAPDEQMYNGEQDIEDEIDFNLSNGNTYDTPNSHEAHEPGIKDDGTKTGCLTCRKRRIKGQLPTKSIIVTLWHLRPVLVSLSRLASDLRERLNNLIAKIQRTHLPANPQNTLVNEVPYGVFYSYLLICFPVKHISMDNLARLVLVQDGVVDQDLFSAPTGVEKLESPRFGSAEDSKAKHIQDWSRSFSRLERH